MRISSAETSVVVFDVDGTLLKNNVGLTFVKFLYRQKKIRPLAKILIITTFALYKARILNFSYAIKAGAWALAGLDMKTVGLLAQNCFDKEIKPTIFEDAYAEIKKCRDNGEIVILATGAHESIAICLARNFEAKHVIATKSVVKGGTYTYEIYKPLPFREGKKCLVQTLIAENYPRSSITVYTDEEKDIPLLSIANTLRAVNADKKTAEYVTQRRGQLLTFR